MYEFPDMSNEIAFKPDVATEAATRADFTYKITQNTVNDQGYLGRSARTGQFPLRPADRCFSVESLES
jgi:hypothetical protein